MANRVIQYKIPSVPSEPEPFHLPLINGGVTYKYVESAIRDNQSPYMLNVTNEDPGATRKRRGQLQVYTTSLGAGAVNMLSDYRKKDGTVKTLLAWGTSLYTQSGTSQPVQILTGLANAKATSFVFNDKFYMINETDYITYDGTTAASVVGYIPIITSSRNPDGTNGTANEELNNLSLSFRDSFAGTAGDVAYHLSYTGLSATALKAWNPAGTLLVENTDFTVNRTTGIVTFNVAPGVGTVVIQAEKTGLTDATIIKKNLYVESFGGKNDTRIFLTGNPDYPSEVYWSDIVDPTYFPINNFAKIGSDADYNKGFAVQYDQLILLKERSLYRIEYDLTGTTVTFPSYPLNSAVGCNMPYTIQIIDNNVVFCNTYGGVYMLTSTNVRTEKNVSRISDNINGAPLRPGLLNEAKADLLTATSADFSGRYRLCVGSKCWVWDYLNSPFTGDSESLAWYYYTNINANCWLVRDTDLFFGDRTTGVVQKFVLGQYSDNGVAINGIWRSKLLYFSLPNWLKTISEVWFRTRAGSYSSITIKYLNDNAEVVDTLTKINTTSFSWALFTWDYFSWAVSHFAPTIRKRPKIKKVTYFQIEFSNNIVNQNLSILDLIIKYSPVKKVK